MPIINHTPQLLKEKNLRPLDLQYHCNIALNTAKSWADPDNPPSKIDLDILEAVCRYLEVSISDVLEYVA